MIAEAPAPGALRANWLNVRVDRAEELPGLIEVLVATIAPDGLLLYGDIPFLWDAFRAGFHEVVAAGGTVTDATGRLLAIHRLGVWDLPKGKVEPDEDVATAAVREVQEECGLAVVERKELLLSTWHTYVRKGRNHLKRTDWYYMEASADQALQAQTEEDIDEVAWLDPVAVQAMRASTYPTLHAVIDAWVERVRKA